MEIDASIDMCMIDVRRALDRLNDYYGGIIDSSLITKIMFEITGELKHHSKFNIPDRVRAKCVDGKIHKGIPANDVRELMLQVRANNPKKKFTDKDWVELLTKYGKGNFVYSYDNDVLYNGIDILTDLYLMKHKCSPKIIDIVHGYASISMNIGPYTEVLETYIRKEKSITAKKDLFIQNMSELDTEEDTFAWDYINNQYKERYTEDGKLRVKYTWAEMKFLSQKLNIITGDFIYRLQTGMSVEEAEQLGKQDKAKYSFVNEQDEVEFNGIKMKGIQYNVIAYIIYKAKEEGLHKQLSSEV